jgi:hypothetical protein
MKRTLKAACVFVSQRPHRYEPISEAEQECVQLDPMSFIGDLPRNAGVTTINTAWRTGSLVRVVRTLAGWLSRRREWRGAMGFYTNVTACAVPRHEIYYGRRR